MKVSKFSDLKPIFEIDIPGQIYEILNEKTVKDDIIAYNQKEQLNEGIDAKGQFIETIASQEQNSGYPYSTFTVKTRGESGLQVDAVNLNDTGAFWNSFEVKVTKETTEVIADFSKGASDIRDNFDKRFDFLGLTENSLENLTWLSIFPKLETRLRKFFGFS